MKKILLLISVSFCIIISFAQTKIGSYYSGSFTIDLTSQERNTVWDSIAAINGYSGSTLDSVVFDDQSPSTIDSAAYVVFYGDYHGTKITVGYYLTKSNNHGAIEYFIDDDNTSVQRAWQCTPPSVEECPSRACKPDRNWFLGPVVGCDCKENEQIPCTLVNSGTGWWPGVLAVITIIVALVT
jgi:hypothetical protein